MIIIPITPQTAGLVKTLNNGVCEDPYVDEPQCFLLNGPSGFTGIISADTAGKLEGKRTEITIDHIEE